VDFVEVAGSGRIRVRTYERGVEAETPACGTGAAASALISSLYAEVGAPPIEVQMPGGILSVDFRRSGDRFTDVWLSGDVYWVCRGEILD
jgi:diaminopimelate epimerase